MTDRDRLIELLKGAENKVAEVLTRPLELEEWLGIYADYLLANGVIVPPCKVGDTIYKLIIFKDGKGYYVPQNVVGFHLGKFPHIRGQERKQYIIVYHEATNTISHIDIKQLGKTVFLTKEEAEQALRQRKEEERK